MKKKYLSPSVVCIDVSEYLMGKAGFNDPISGFTTPEESDAKYYDEWEDEEDEEYDTYGFDYKW